MIRPCWRGCIPRLMLYDNSYPHLCRSREPKWETISASRTTTENTRATIITTVQPGKRGHAGIVRADVKA